MGTAYITFGQVHVHSVNGKTFDKDCVAAIEAQTWGDARDKAFELFGPKWHQCYWDELPDMSYFPRGVISVDASIDDVMREQAWPDEFYQALGWMHSACCAALDRGEDPRQLEVPVLVAQCKTDLTRD